MLAMVFSFMFLQGAKLASWLLSEKTCFRIEVFKKNFFYAQLGADFCRLKAEQERLERIGPVAYYSEWVKAWKRDTSQEAIQKHFEETGEDENAQLIEMFSYQTDREYRIMMGTDARIRRDPLAMRMKEDQIKQSTYFILISFS